MKADIPAGTTSLLIRVPIQDSSSTKGAYLTGVTSAMLAVSYSRDDQGNAGATVVTLSAGTRGTWSSGGFVEKDSTNAKGEYEFGVPNAALVAGSKTVTLNFQDAGANNIVPFKVEIELTGINVFDGVRGGMTAMPNVAQGAAGCLTTSSDGTTLNVASGVAQSNMKQVDSVALSTHASGMVPADVRDFGGAAGTFSGGKPAVLDSSGASFTYTTPPTTASIATAIWQDLTASSDFTTLNSIGKLLVTNIDTNIGSRMATFTLPTNFSVLAIDGSGRVDLGKILGTASAGAAGSVSIDWAHIVGSTATVNLSGTTINIVGGVSGDVSGKVLGSGSSSIIGPGVQPNDSDEAYNHRWFVSLEGSDTLNAGTSPLAPFRTWQKALSVATAGDLIQGTAESFSETGNMVIPAKVTLRGMGQVVTIISLDSASSVTINSGARFVDLTLNGNATHPLITTSTTTADVSFRNAFLSGQISDNANILIQCWFIDCLLQTSTSCVAISNANTRLAFRRCDFISATGATPSGATIPVSTGRVDIFDCDFNTAASVDIAQSGAGIINITADCCYLQSKVTGSPTIIPLNNLILDPRGVDQITIETGVNARQAIAVIAAEAAGVTAGAGTNSFTIAALNNPSTNRISATTDSAGDRTLITLNLP